MKKSEPYGPVTGKGDIEMSTEVVGHVSISPKAAEDAHRMQREGSFFTLFETTENRTFASKALGNFLMKNLPHTNYDPEDISRGHLAVPAFTVFSLSWLIIFALYFTYGVQKYLGSTFLSLSKTSEFQTCNDVPVTITGSYELDIFGHWSTDVRFQSNSSIFKVSFDASSITLEEYQTTMMKFQERISELDVILSQHDVTFAAVAWSTFYTLDAGTQMSISTTADWNIIFSQYYRKASASRGYAASGALEDCAVVEDGVEFINQPVVSTPAAGMVSLSWSLECNSSNTACGWDEIIQVYNYTSIFSLYTRK